MGPRGLGVSTKQRSLQAWLGSTQCAASMTHIRKLAGTAQSRHRTQQMGHKAHAMQLLKAKARKHDHMTDGRMDAGQKQGPCLACNALLQVMTWLRCGCSTLSDIACAHVWLGSGCGPRLPCLVYGCASCPGGMMILGSVCGRHSLIAVPRHGLCPGMSSQPTHRSCPAYALPKQNFR